MPGPAQVTGGQLPDTEPCSETCVIVALSVVLDGMMTCLKGHSVSVISAIGVVPVFTVILLRPTALNVSEVDELVVEGYQPG